VLSAHADGHDLAESAIDMPPASPPLAVTRANRDRAAARIAARAIQRRGVGVTGSYARCERVSTSPHGMQSALDVNLTASAAARI
jgi:hypothetical protein